MNKADRETLSAIIQTQIGVSKKLKGYQYLEDAVEIALFFGTVVTNRTYARFTKLIDFFYDFVLK